MSSILDFFTTYHLLEIGFLTVFLLVLRHYTVKKAIPFLLSKSKKKISQRILSYYINTIFLLFLIYSIIRFNEFDITLFETYDGNSLTFSDILIGFLIVEMAFLVNFLANQLWFNRSLSNNPEDEKLYLDNKSSGTQSFKYVLTIVALRFITTVMGLNYSLFHNEQITIRVNDVLKIILIVLLANFISFLFIKVFLQRYYRRREVNTGTQYSINQLVKYFIYVILLLVGIESIGIELTVIWAGLAALMVGIGLGLQTTFSDFVSGIILLFERSIEVGNTVQVENNVGIVQRIGLRSCSIQLRDHRVMMVPNSKMINSIVMNWDGDHKINRFSVTVGVAYGSDVKFVRDILLDVARKNNYVEQRPIPSVRFENFGDSSLNFELLFWSRISITIEDVQSDIRFEIHEAFMENDIKIPFPQRDLWIKSWPEQKM